MVAPVECTQRKRSQQGWPGRAGTAKRIGQHSVDLGLLALVFEVVDQTNPVLGQPRIAPTQLARHRRRLGSIAGQELAQTGIDETQETRTYAVHAAACQLNHRTLALSDPLEIQSEQPQAPFRHWPQSLELRRTFWVAGPAQTLVERQESQAGIVPPFTAAARPRASRKRVRGQPAAVVARNKRGIARGRNPAKQIIEPAQARLSPGGLRQHRTREARALAFDLE